MAEPIRPAEEASVDTGRPVAETPVNQPTSSAPSAPAEEEQEVTYLVPERNEDATAVVAPAPTAATEPPPTTVLPSAPPEEQPVIAPAAEAAPPPPVKAGNRIVATAWVLLAAGLFQVLFFGINALVALVFGGAQAVVPQVQSIAGTTLAWLPVLLFFLFFELVVLLINRAGRVAYVLASLIVGVIVYVLTVLLFSLITSRGLGDANTLAQTFLNWEFILVGLVAREVMLWTGLAIGARGIRVRRRNKEARRRYDEELADARA